MSLNPQVIGKIMPHGYAGVYARQPDMIVNTRPAGEAVLFGQALVYNANGQVVLPAAGAKAADFVGVAAAEVKSALNYLTQSAGSYAARRYQCEMSKRYGGSGQRGLSAAGAQ